MCNINAAFTHQITLKTDDMDLAGDIIQSLAAFVNIEVRYQCS